MESIWYGDTGYLSGEHVPYQIPSLQHLAATACCNQGIFLPKENSQQFPPSCQNDDFNAYRPIDADELKKKDTDVICSNVVGNDCTNDQDETSIVMKYVATDKSSILTSLNNDKTKQEFVNDVIDYLDLNSKLIEPNLLPGVRDECVIEHSKHINPSPAEEIHAISDVCNGNHKLEMEGAKRTGSVYSSSDSPDLTLYQGASHNFKVTHPTRFLIESDLPFSLHIEIHGEHRAYSNQYSYQYQPEKNGNPKQRGYFKLEKDNLDITYAYPHTNKPDNNFILTYSSNSNQNTPKDFANPDCITEKQSINVKLKAAPATISLHPENNEIDVNDERDNQCDVKHSDESESDDDDDGIKVIIGDLVTTTSTLSKGSEVSSRQFGSNNGYKGISSRQFISNNGYKGSSLASSSNNNARAINDWMKNGGNNVMEDGSENKSMSNNNNSRKQPLAMYSHSNSNITQKGLQSTGLFNNTPKQNDYHLNHRESYSGPVPPTMPTVNNFTPMFHTLQAQHVPPLRPHFIRDWQHRHIPCDMTVNRRFAGWQTRLQFRPHVMIRHHHPHFPMPHPRYNGPGFY